MPRGDSADKDALGRRVPRECVKGHPYVAIKRGSSTRCGTCWKLYKVRRAEANPEQAAKEDEAKKERSRKRIRPLKPRKKPAHKPREACKRGHRYPEGRIKERCQICLRVIQRRYARKKRKKFRLFL